MAQNNTSVVLVSIGLLVFAALGVWWYVNMANSGAVGTYYYAQPSTPQSGQLEGSVVAP